MLNREELAIGAVLGLGFFWAIGWWCVPLALVTSLLWALGGLGWLGTKAWRRFGVPTAIWMMLNLLKQWSCVGWLYLLAFVMSVVLLSVGYGTRSLQPPDAGSPLGNFWQDHLGINDEDLSKWLSRSTIILAVWLIWYLAI